MVGTNQTEWIASQQNDTGLFGDGAAFTFAVEGVLILITFVIGLVGNGLAIVIFSRQKIHQTFHNLFLLLAIFDLVSTLLHLTHKGVKEDFQLGPFFATFA